MSFKKDLIAFKENQSVQEFTKRNFASYFVYAKKGVNMD